MGLENTLNVIVPHDRNETQLNAFLQHNSAQWCCILSILLFSDTVL